VVTAVQEWFLLPEFVQARGSPAARTYNKVGTWWASQHYQDMNERTAGQLDKRENSAYELGFDGAELTIASGNTTYIAFLRCAYTLHSVSAAETCLHLAPLH
jgi:hypothetical protein